MCRFLRRIVCVTVLSSALVGTAAGAETEWAWHDARTLLVEGQGWADPNGAYVRLPARAKGW
jgi:hypothetical protein